VTTTIAASTPRTRRVAILGGGRLAFGALAMVRAAVAAGSRFSLQGFGRSAAARAVLRDGGAVVVDSIAAAVDGADLVVVCVPAPALHGVVAEAAATATGDQVVLHAARGVGAGFALPHQVLRGGSCWKKIVVIGGPIYLDDAGSGRILNAAIASRFDEALAAVRGLVKGAPIRLSATHDIVGVELCGALSNVGHLATGLAAGAGLSETDQGLLHVRALLEAGRFGRALGAEPGTFSGLAGVGDLIPRRVSSQKMHRDVGFAIATHATTGGDTDVDIPVDLEGAVTAREGVAFARRQQVDAPLMRAVVAILDDGASVGSTLREVLDTDLGLQAA
jgi:glycerol-3-phosphate dehydrogenase (NAD(P)+)